MIEIKNEEIKRKLLKLEKKYFDFFGEDMPTYFMISKNNIDCFIDENEIKKLEIKVNECISKLTPYNTGFDIRDVLT